nr:bifunctional phosphopantothenoylcysteine decarboxylase/phosphopantothenate--cysteine ligase CoaBC [Lentilactobacillus kisonensis]
MSDLLQGKNVALFVTGSIAAYKALLLTRLLVKHHNDVHVLMTESAQQFINPVTFEVLSKNRVITNDFSGENPKSIPHVKVADDADLAIVAPATANTIAKMATGLADNVVSATLLAMSKPIFVVPAMNTHMLANFATQNNLQQLAEHRVQVMPSAQGFLAEGYSGRGRMPEPSEIFDWISNTYQPAKQLLAGKRVIVTAGGTREPLDPVRYLTNRSSGKMGYAIAEAAQSAGADVTLISANAVLPTPTNVNLVRIQTAAELLAAVEEQFQSADILIMAAAVADYRPEHVASTKIKKRTDNQTINLKLVRNPDILQTISKIKQDDQIIVGFAAETNDLLANAAKKIKAKKLDMIVANDVSNPQIGFNSENNQATFLFANGQQVKTDIESKREVASHLIDTIYKRFFNQAK